MGDVVLLNSLILKNYENTRSILKKSQDKNYYLKQMTKKIIKNLDQA